VPSKYQRQANFYLSQFFVRAEGNSPEKGIKYLSWTKEKAIMEFKQYCKRMPSMKAGEN
jgi:hypothetical protein